MKKIEVKAAIVERIKEKRALEGASLVMTDINECMKSYPELSHREKVFAFRYVLDPKTYHQHAAYFNVSFGTIQNMMNNPRVLQLIDDIQFNFDKQMVGSQLLLVREAVMQILRIFHAPEYPESLDAKRKMVNGVLQWVGISTESSEDNPRPVNVNILPGQRASLFQSDDSTMNVSMEQVEREYKELKRLEEYREDAHKQSRADNERRSSVKRIGGGFHDAPPIDVEVSK